VVVADGRRRAGDSDQMGGLLAGERLAAAGLVLLL